jgi:hypothetical protein
MRYSTHDLIVKAMEARRKRTEWEGNSPPYPWRECKFCFEQLHDKDKVLCAECQKTGEMNKPC